jgi:HTH-type transcriptional regulator/antitoxin MqsA
MSLEGTRCPVCGVGSLSHRVKRVVVDIAEYERVIEQPGFWCDHCEEGIIGGADLKATEAEFQGFRAFVREQHAQEVGRDLSRIRRRLGLTQAEAARLAGGGKNAFSRYEHGQAKPVAAVVNLFRLLDRHPELLEELRRSGAP